MPGRRGRPEGRKGYINLTFVLPTIADLNQRLDQVIWPLVFELQGLLYSVEGGGCASNIDTYNFIRAVQGLLRRLRWRVLCPDCHESANFGYHPNRKDGTFRYSHRHHKYHGGRKSLDEIELSPQEGNYDQLIIESGAYTLLAEAVIPSGTVTNEAKGKGGRGRSRLINLPFVLEKIADLNRRLDQAIEPLAVECQNLLNSLDKLGCHTRADTRDLVEAIQTLLTRLRLRVTCPICHEPASQLAARNIGKSGCFHYVHGGKQKPAPGRKKKATHGGRNYFDTGQLTPFAVNVDEIDD